MSTTIRKNAFQKIHNILSGCVLIRQFKYDDMGNDMQTVSADDVIAAGREYEFDRVSETDDQIRCSIHRNFAFTGYKSIDGARRTMTPRAFRECFSWVDADGFIPLADFERATAEFGALVSGALRPHHDDDETRFHLFATNGAEICEQLGHIIIDESSAGPDSGNMDWACAVCGLSASVPLY